VLFARAEIARMAVVLLRAPETAPMRIIGSIFST
jgi:hypothetical protein